MAIQKFKVEVTHYVEVELDDEKLDDEFNKNFSRYFFEVETLEEHAKHLAQMEARGLIGFDNFVEGYGDISALNCKVKITDQEEYCDS